MRKRVTKHLIYCLMFIFYCTESTSQTCQYSNPFPPISGSCYSNGGNVRDIFIFGHCSAFSGGTITGGSYSIVVEDKTITFGGNLIIDQNVTFKRCTLLFNGDYGIQLSTVYWYPGLIPPIFTTVANFEDCYLAGCDGAFWKGISSFTGGGNYNQSLKIFNTTISKANIGINLSLGSSFAGDYDFNNIDFLENGIGIKFTGRTPRNLLIKDCNFIGGETGIHLENFSAKISSSNSFTLNTKNNFTDQQTAIYAFKVAGIRITNQEINNCTYGIDLHEIKSAATENIYIRNNSILSAHKAISIFKAEVNSNAFISQNNLTGTGTGLASSCGISIANCKNFRGNINGNPSISNFGVGIRILGVSHNSLKIDSNKGITNSNGGYGIFYANSVNMAGAVNIGGNKLFDKAKVVFSFPYNFKLNNNIFNYNSSLDNLIDIKNSGFLGMEGNTFINTSTNTGSNSLFKLSNSFATNMCCNNFEGSGNNMYLLGTNAVTQIRNSTFVNGKMTLDNTMIGVNDHAGNRWQGSTLGRLIGGDPGDNQFKVNYTESNVNLGNIIPQIIEPTSIASFWFVNDENGNSTGCTSKCGVQAFSPIDPFDLLPIPDSISNLGSCYPYDVDRDGDGICDTSDPDPDDSCIPILLDADNDGVCDPIDPDPTDGCNPIYRDTDRDGFCDSSDPDPSDPCIPNSLDSDGDGICDTLDPDPVNPDPINIISVNDCWWLTDANGDRLWTLGYHNTGLLYTINSLESIALKEYGPEPGAYDQLKYVESMSFLYEILHSSPYYRLVSEILNDKYLELCDSYSSIPQYVKISNDIRLLDKPSNLFLDNLLKKELFLNRLSNVAKHLNANNSSDSLILVGLNQVFLSKSEEINTLKENFNSIREEKIPGLISEIASLPEDYPIYNALKDFYLIFSSKELEGNSLSSTQLETLNSMANLCPLIFWRGST